MNDPADRAVLWMDVSNLERLADRTEEPEVVEWLRDLATRLRAILHAAPASAEPLSTEELARVEAGKVVGALGLSDGQIEQRWAGFRARATEWTPEIAPYDFLATVFAELCAALRARGEDRALLESLAAFLASESIDNDFGLTLKNLSGRRIDAEALSDKGFEILWSSDNTRDYGANLRHVLRQIVAYRPTDGGE